MTLIVAAEGSDFVILGSDSLGTYGGYGDTTVCVETIKWYEVAKHVAILSAGDGDLNNALINGFKDTLNPRDDGVTPITNKFIEFCRQSFQHTKNFHFEGGAFPGCFFIIAGLDKRGNKYTIPNTYVTRSYDDFMLRSDNLGYKLGGITMLARYLFKKYYHDAKSSVDSLASLVTGSLNDIIKVARDGGVGEPISLLKIDESGIFEFRDRGIENYILSWNSYTNWRSVSGVR